METMGMNPPIVAMGLIPSSTTRPVAIIIAVTVMMIITDYWTAFMF